MIRRFRSAVFALNLVTLTAIGAGTPAAAANDGAVIGTLENLRDQDLWGEAVLDQGRVRQIKVQSISGDTVFVRQVVGPFQERDGIYTLAEFRTVRELGDYRIPQRRSPYRSHKSLLTGLLFEAAVPGGGYYYAGEKKQAFVLVLISAAATATAIRTGGDGAAGWVPIMAWTKVASMLHLVDEIGASNASHGHSDGSVNDGSGDSRFLSSAGATEWDQAKDTIFPLVQLRHSF